MLLFVLFILGTTILEVNSEGYYKVVGGRSLRPNSHYHVSVSVSDTAAPTTVRLEVSGRQSDGNIFTVRESLLLEPPYSTRVTNLQIGDISEGSYRLSAQGSGGISFQSSSPLKLVNQSYSVFIQTDRSIYGPGHKIQFRAIVLNSSLRPAAEVRTEPLYIKITDGANNIVKEWKDVNSPRGIFNGELNLSENPVLGNWKICVKIHNQTFSKTIPVLYLILPKYLVDIQTKKHVTFGENFIAATINSRYDYGEKVKGDVTVTMYPTILSGVIQPIFQDPIRKVVKIDGSTEVEFNIAQDLRLNDEYERLVTIEAIVEEQLTGRRQNNSIAVFVHKYDYKMELIKTADYLKPGLKYVAYIKVSNHDGSPIREDKRKVTVRYGYSKLNEIYEEDVYKLDQNGVTKLVIYPPKDIGNNTALRIEAEYLELREWFSPITPSASKSNNYITAEVMTDRPVVNQDIEISINCTEAMGFVSYEIIGRGDIVLAGTLAVRGEKHHSFHFTASQSMAPSAYLLVSYVRPDGENIADSIRIDVGGVLQNYVDIQLNTPETTPESDIDLLIRAQPNSYIGILAVTEGPGPNTDITYNEIKHNLENYDSALKSPYNTSKTDNFFWKPGSGNTREMYEDSGMILLSNTLSSNYKNVPEEFRKVQTGDSTVKPDRGPVLALETYTRPPLAGPYAFSRIPKPALNIPHIHLSEKPQPTFLFANISSGFEGKSSFRKKLPSVSTSWKVTGFSLDPLYGLGVVNLPRNLKVSKNFEVSLDLPASIQRGEILAVPVVVRNDRNEDLVVEVTIHNLENRFTFDFAEKEKQNNVTKLELFRKKKLNVKRNNSASTSFIIKATLLGYADVKVTASAGKMQDTAQKQLNIRAEGEAQYYTKTVLLDLRKTSAFKGNLTIEIPKNVIPNSELVEVSVSSDILGSVVANLGHLTRKPTHCGEQNLLHMISDVLTLDYLDKRNKKMAQVENDAIERLQIHYQEQLNYKASDGSFTVYGLPKSNGSVWITALTAQALNKVKKYVFVDNGVILDALKWLEGKQAPNGSFVESGEIVYQKMQNNSADSISLTALVAISFYENKEKSPKFIEISRRAFDYISSQISESTDTYSLAISTYALHLSDHPAKRTALNLLESRSKNNITSKWWAEEIPLNEQMNPWHSLPKSIDIEMTSYALLSYVEAGLLEDSTPVLNWLINQTNSFGGFTSSRDTVTGLNSLVKLLEKVSDFTDMKVQFMYRKQESTSVNLNKDNSFVVHKYQISPTARLINITAEGSGLAVLRLSYRYNKNVTGPWPSFTLDPQVDKNSHKYHLQLSVCTALISSLPDIKSNMALIEVNLPSGFTADRDSLPSLQLSQCVRKVTTSNHDTTVLLYLDKLDKTEVCPTIRAFRTSRVAGQKPVAVKVYDYYDSSAISTVFYYGPVSRVCDICQEEDCDKACVLDPETRVGEDSSEKVGGKNNGVVIMPGFAFVIVWLNLVLLKR